MRTSCFAISGCLLLALLCAGCGSGSTSVNMPPPVLPHLFVTNSADDTISNFVIDTKTGALTSAGAPIPISPAHNPGALALVNNSFLVVANQGSNNTSVFKFDSSAGTLTQVSGSPFSDSGGMHTGIALHPSGKFIYITAMPFGVIGLQINPSTGALSPIPGSPFGQNMNSNPLLDAAGKYFYTTGFQTISINSVDPITGKISPIQGSPFPFTFNNMTGVTLHPSGKFLYGVEDGYMSLHTYTVDPVSGVLHEAQGSPTFQPQVDPWNIVIEPSGKFAFTPNTTRGTVATWKIDAVAGTLAWVGEVNAGTFPTYITLASTGAFLYVSNFRSNNISGYKIDASTGTLTPVAGSPFPAGSFPAGIITSQ